MWRLDPGIGSAYAAVSGDRNPIHTSRLGARAFGFRRRIAHGMWTKARCLAQLGPRLPAAYTVEVTFHAPVWLPSTVGFSATPDGDTWRFALHRVPSGRRHWPVPYGRSVDRRPPRGAAGRASSSAGGRSSTRIVGTMRRRTACRCRSPPPPRQVGCTSATAWTRCACGRQRRSGGRLAAVRPAAEVRQRGAVRADWYRGTFEITGRSIGYSPHGSFVLNYRSKRWGKSTAPSIRAGLPAAGAGYLFAEDTVWGKPAPPPGTSTTSSGRGGVLSVRQDRTGSSSRSSASRRPLGPAGPGPAPATATCGRTPPSDQGRNG